MTNKIRIPSIVSRAACFWFAALVFITPALAQRRERLVDTCKPLHYDVTIEFNDQLTEIARAQHRVVIFVGIELVQATCDSRFVVMDLQFSFSLVSIRRRKGRGFARVGKHACGNLGLAAKHPNPWTRVLIPGTT